MLRCDDVSGRAVILAPGALGTTAGKTANGLVRFTRRFDIVAVVDPVHAGEDAGMVLDGAPVGIPVVGTVAEAMKYEPQWAVVGCAPPGGRLPPELRPYIEAAISCGLGVASGLHEFLREDPDIATWAGKQNVRLIDVRSLTRSEHMFSGIIEEVRAPRVAVLGTDAAVGKRTTAWKLVEALEARGTKALLVGTGATAWLQGASHCVVLDRIVNDFVTGELEHAIHQAWTRERPDVIVLEGQSALSHPACPAGLELIAGGRPAAIVMVHAPGRKARAGFEACPMPVLKEEIRLAELLSRRPLSAIAINHERLTPAQVDRFVTRYGRDFRVPVTDPVLYGGSRLADGVLDALAGKAQRLPRQPRAAPRAH